MGLGQVLAVRAVALEEVGHGVEPVAVDAQVEPEAQGVEHRLLHVRVVEVQVGLVVEEAVPEVLAAHRVPRPVRGLGVEEDDARLAPRLVAVRPDVPVAVRAGRVAPRGLEPLAVARRVVHDEVRDHADAAAVRGLDERAEVLDLPVVGVHVVGVGDVVAAVPERRGEHRQQPDAVDAEPLQVVELLDHPAQVARPVAVGVEEAADVDLVEDGALEPERVALEPVLRRVLGARGSPSRSADHPHDVGLAGREAA